VPSRQIHHDHSVRPPAAQRNRETRPTIRNPNNPRPRRLLQQRIRHAHRMRGCDQMGDLHHNHRGEDHDRHPHPDYQRFHAPHCNSSPNRRETGYATKMSETPNPETAPFAIIAPLTSAGERADRFLAQFHGSLSRSRIKTLIESGFATIDGTPFTAPAEPVRAGALYQLTPPAPVAARPTAQQDIPFKILFEDAHLLVLDKPAGLVVHPAPGNEDGTLVNALLAHCGDSLPGIGGERRPGIVHRLDRDTSGVMVVAKNESTLAALSATFAARDLDRSYIALAWGLVPAKGEVDAPIGRDPRDRKRMAVRASGGKQALTHFTLEEVFHGGVSRITCKLATGRTHQIRVHLAHISHPLVGDPVYLRRVPGAAKSLPEPLRRRLLDFPRQALHAAVLGFRHPATGEYLSFTTPPPLDFATLLADLRGVPAPII